MKEQRLYPDHSFTNVFSLLRAVLAAMSASVRTRVCTDTSAPLREKRAVCGCACLLLVRRGRWFGEIAHLPPPSPLSPPLLTSHMTSHASTSVSFLNMRRCKKNNPRREELSD